ncbi:MAG: beta-galactosidase, partial [Bacteroidales bacterium]|nr:beta-galactosidase [Bacteroidales bacterium]
MRITFIYLAAILVLIGSCKTMEDSGENRIDLSGEWKFAVDPMDKGIDERWYASGLSETVNLPGSMAENGKGDEPGLATDWTGSIVDSSYFYEEKYARYREPDHFKIPFWLMPVKCYKGPAWYQKEVFIPVTWKDKRIFLSLERCHWETTVYVDDQKAGIQNSLSVPHRYDLTEFMLPGKHILTIRIDNRLVIPVGINSHSVSDHTQTNWNGIVGEIFMEARDPVYIEDVQVYPDIVQKSVKLRISLMNPAGISFNGAFNINAESYNTDDARMIAGEEEKIELTDKMKEFEMDFILGEEMQLWDEFSPVLYQLNVSLLDDAEQEVDRKAVDFGMREFKANKTRFELNGRPVFLRGTVECCIFPLTGYPSMDEESWEYIFEQCHEYGLNHMRFHSYCPPEAAFRAADKFGFYLQVECGSWANWPNSSVGDGLPVDQFIYAESDRILKAYGNHPSFCMLAYGNEPGGNNQEAYLGELVNYWKAKDRRRVYTSGAGWPFIDENDYHNGPEPRIQHWGEGLGSIINSKPPQTVFDYGEFLSEYNIPWVSHEIGQWCAYPNFNEIPKYTGVLKPANFEIFQETLEENYMGEQAEDFLMASGKLQVTCYKADIEAALRTPGFAGFQLLQLHDFPGQGTALVGILDAFFESKGYVTPYEFKRFCSET